jgi:hypothetical protein
MFDAIKLLIMNSIVVKNGLMAAGAAIILGLVVYLIDPKGFLSWGSWLTLVPILYFMVSAVKETRNENGGFISLRQAFHSRLDHLPLLRGIVQPFFLHFDEFH